MFSTGNLVTHLRWSVTLHYIDKHKQDRHMMKDEENTQTGKNKTTTKWPVLQHGTHCFWDLHMQWPDIFTQRPQSLTKLTNKTPACLSVSWLLILQGSTSGLIPYYLGYVAMLSVSIWLSHTSKRSPHAEQGDKQNSWLISLSCNQCFFKLYRHPEPLSARHDRGNVEGSDWLLNPSHFKTTQ